MYILTEDNICFRGLTEAFIRTARCQSPLDGDYCNAADIKWPQETRPPALSWRTVGGKIEAKRS